MKPNAVCVACGALKKAALAACPACGFEPKSEYEAARSLILSKRFHAGDMEIGRTAAELQSIADEIRAGRPYRFDPQEQHRVVEQYRNLAGAETKRPTLAFLKWLVPLTLILGLLIALLWPK